MARAVAAARAARSTTGPWPRLTHAERAELPARARRRARGARRRRSAELWPRESGVLAQHRRSTPGDRRAARLRRTTPRWPTRSRSRSRPRRPPAASSACSCASRSAWSARSSRGTRRSALICHKIAPALLAGCTVVLKSSPEAPGEGYVFAEVAEADRPAAGRAQRRHRRPRGLRAARPRPARRQDHLHRLDRRRPADRVALRRADRPLHARARRQVGGGHPRRHRPRHRGRRRSPAPSAS